MGILVLAAISLCSFRQFSLYTAERLARSVAESIKAGLTESMVNGAIGKRSQYLDRLTGVPRVQEIRVIRSAAVVNQFGTGLTVERLLDAEETKVLSRGEPTFDTHDKDGATLFHAIIPYIASSQGTPKTACNAMRSATAPLKFPFLPAMWQETDKY